MPLDKDILAAAIVAEITAQFGAPADAGKLAAFAAAIAKAVVEHIQANAVTTCGAGSGTVG